MMAPMQKSLFTIRTVGFFSLAISSLLFSHIALAQIEMATISTSNLRLEPVTEEEKEEFPTLQKIDPSVIEAMQATLSEGEEPTEEEIEDAMESVPPGQQDEVLEEIKELLKRREQLALERELREAEAAAAAAEQEMDQTTAEGWLSEYWVQFWALVAGLLSVFLAVSGFSLAGRKKKKSLSHLMNEIDETFDSFKSKSKRCEAELYRLQDVIEDKLKSGKIDESTFQLLEGRIHKYMKEVQEVHDPIHHASKKNS